MVLWQRRLQSGTSHLFSVRRILNRSTLHSDPAHHALVFVVDVVAVHHHPLGKVHSTKPDPAIIASALNGIVVLAIEMGRTAKGLDVKNVGVEGVALGADECPFLCGLVGNGEEGRIGVPGLAVDGSVGE